jgi:DNA-binding MarR family transcriptional regulator
LLFEKKANFSYCFAGLYTTKLKTSLNHNTPSIKLKKGFVRTMVKLNKTDKLVLEVLGDEELTLQEIADKTGEKPKKVFKVLRKLFEKELVDTKSRKYKRINK